MANKKHEIVFVNYGVEFTSTPQSENVSNDCIKKLEDKGITSCYKREIGTHVVATIREAKPSKHRFSLTNMHLIDSHDGKQILFDSCDCDTLEEVIAKLKGMADRVQELSYLGAST